MLKHVMLSLALLFLPLTPALAEEANEISWDDLMPEGWIPLMPQQDPEFFASHEESVMPSLPEPQALPPTVPELNGKQVKIPGYILPIKYDTTSVSEFLLVPFVGACIHVPPPPENQMIYIKLAKPYVSEGLWAPVWVSGTLEVKQADTQYATALYQMNDGIAQIYE